MQVTPLSTNLDQALKALDLEWRLRNIPATAQIRGVFFNGLREEVERRNLESVPDLARILNVPRRSYALYPVADYVKAGAIAGALVHSDPREGLREIFRETPAYATQTWYGKIFVRYLRPYDGLRWLEKSRDYICNYGRWRLEYRDEWHAIMHKYDEYFWIDALRGACEGMLSLCGMRSRIDIESDSPFNGRLLIHWERR